LKPLRQNKVLGLALGEQSLLAAEVAVGGGDEPPATRQLAEFVYPEGVNPQHPAALGRALAGFLKEHHFTARSAIVGIPARWLVVKPKDVPPADAATLADMLRLQAEGEFSSELKDLVYDYTATASSNAADANAASSNGSTIKSVLLLATAKKYIDGATEMCEAARLNLLAVTPSVVALGAVTGRTLSADALVLAVSPAGAELTAQCGGVSSAIRALRAPGGGERSFVGELRRAVSTLPTGTSTGSQRELVLWGDAGVPDTTLGESLGFKVRSGDLPGLGVTTGDSTSNGDGRKYAAAVALALSGVDDNGPVVDFLHSRLAPPKVHRIPRWAYVAAVAVIAAIAYGVVAYRDLQNEQAALAKKMASVANQQSTFDAAEDFVKNVNIAHEWHRDNPRYLSCLRDITSAIPEDGQTYATNVDIKELVKPATPGGSASSKLPGPAPGTLSGKLFIKTTDQKSAQAVVDRMHRNPAFLSVQPGPTSDVGRGHEVQSSIDFIYLAPKQAK
jgi:hypothetical protein